MWLTHIDSEVLSGIGSALKVIYFRIGSRAAPESHKSQHRLLVIANESWCTSPVTVSQNIVSEPSLLLHRNAC